MTNRRKSFMKKWAPAHGMTIEEATAFVRRTPGLITARSRHEIFGSLIGNVN